MEGEGHKPRREASPGVDGVGLKCIDSDAGSSKREEGQKPEKRVLSGTVGAGLKCLDSSAGGSKEGNEGVIVSIEPLAETSQKLKEQSEIVEALCLTIKNESARLVQLTAAAGGEAQQVEAKKEEAVAGGTTSLLRSVKELEEHLATLKVLQRELVSSGVQIDQVAPGQPGEANGGAAEEARAEASSPKSHQLLSHADMVQIDQSEPGQLDEASGGAAEEARTEDSPKPRQVLSHADMIHYLDVTGGWDEDLCACCFDQAPRSIRAAAKEQQQLNQAAFESVQVVLEQAVREKNGASHQSQSAGKPGMAPRLCAEAMLLEWMAEPLIAAELGASRQRESDNFASMLVQVLGLKESADLKEGFGFYVQHVLSGRLEKAHAEGGGMGGAEEKAAEEVHGEGKGRGRAAEKAVECKLEIDGVASKCARVTKDSRSRERLKGRVWERFGAIPKPLEESSVAMEWEEWSQGDEAAVKFPANRKERCFGLGIGEERDEAAEKLTQDPPNRISEAVAGSRRAKEKGFAYRPVSHLFSRVLSVFPPSSPGFDEVVECLELPGRLPRPLNLHMILRRAEQVPLFFLIHMAAAFSHYLLGTDAFKKGYSGSGRAEKVKVQGRWVGETDQENGGEVWEEVRMWYSVAMAAWRFNVGSEGEVEECRGRYWERMAEECDITWVLEAAIAPRYCEGLPGQHGFSRESSTAAGSSSSSRSVRSGKGKQGEEPAHLKAWPGGVNLVACLREMLLGEPCYRPASPGAPSAPATTHSAAAMASRPPAPSTPTSISISAAAAAAAAAAASDVQGRVCGAAGCGTVEGGGVNLRRCGGCGKVVYCSRECQKAHWPFHKLTCPGRTSGKRSGTYGSKDGCMKIGKESGCEGSGQRGGKERWDSGKTIGEVSCMVRCKDSARHRRQSIRKESWKEGRKEE
ncbi:unnamed protein product [Closterium sp. NIES-65]|nr:unnamed protein product [Closterium sp. NIES-65]